MRDLQCRTAGTELNGIAGSELSRTAGSELNRTAGSELVNGWFQGVLNFKGSLVS